MSIDDEVQTDSISEGKDPVADWATDFDHTHPDYAANAPQIWDELRSSCPVAHTERFGGMWIPTRHDDVKLIADNPDGNYTSHEVVVNDFQEQDLLPPPIGPAPPITSDWIWPWPSPLKKNHKKRAMGNKPRMVATIPSPTNTRSALKVV